MPTQTCAGAGSGGHSASGNRRGSVIAVDGVLTTRCHRDPSAAIEPSRPDRVFKDSSGGDLPQTSIPRPRTWLTLLANPFASARRTGRQAGTGSKTKVLARGIEGPPEAAPPAPSPPYFGTNARAASTV
jgi:hypothetical protein